MDVLEHLEDDHAMLKAIKEKSVGENFFFITVPAFMSLWSGHDAYLGHYRRYTLASLRRLLYDSRYTYHNLYFLYGFIFPAVWMARRMKKKNSDAQSDMKPMSTAVNGILKMICSIEIPFRKMNRMWGVTCVAEGKI